MSDMKTEHMGETYTVLAKTEDNELTEKIAVPIGGDLSEAEIIEPSISVGSVVVENKTDAKEALSKLYPEKEINVIVNHDYFD